MEGSQAGPHFPPYVRKPPSSPVMQILTIPFSVSRKSEQGRLDRIRIRMHYRLYGTGRSMGLYEKDLNDLVHELEKVGRLLNTVVDQQREDQKVIKLLEGIAEHQKRTYDLLSAIQEGFDLTIEWTVWVVGGYLVGGPKLMGLAVILRLIFSFLSKQAEAANNFIIDRCPETLQYPLLFLLSGVMLALLMVVANVGLILAGFAPVMDIGGVCSRLASFLSGWLGSSS